MKLIVEHNFKNVNVVKEEETKDLFIEGVFMQAEVKNRNGRIYPLPVLESQVDKYVKEYVKAGRSIGELNHPDSPIVNPKEASHLITSLRKEGNNFVGKAKILTTPMGNVVRGLLEGGVKLGVSSRGMGSIKEREDGINEVQDDFILSTIDIVHDPSAPDAFVNGIMEGVEWIYDNGKLKATQIDDYRRDIEKAKNKEAAMLEAFQDFLRSLK
jgi:hypothetical protein